MTEVAFLLYDGMTALADRVVVDGKVVTAAGVSTRQRAADVLARGLAPTVA